MTDAAVQLAVERAMAGLGILDPVREMVAGEPLATLCDIRTWARLAAATAQWCVGWGAARFFPRSRILSPGSTFGNTMRFTGAAWYLGFRALDGSRHWADFSRERTVSELKSEIVQRLAPRGEPLVIPVFRELDANAPVPVDFTGEVLRRSKVFPVPPREDRAGR
ncbi:hypothetical protein [Amycolatopsis sp.]|uniref:hypothetical protein n=1 Tax=Amycolatopsis sp. TaxID=37632 RepID=UPI002C0194D6|nr:hypothetical protein [Amycolatopsis sp.]HVV08923.1 hypothetical protein [Amycolatopsis sp.]